MVTKNLFILFIVYAGSLGAMESIVPALSSGACRQDDLMKSEAFRSSDTQQQLQDYWAQSQEAIQKKIAYHKNSLHSELASCGTDGSRNQAYYFYNSQIWSLHMSWKGLNRMAKRRGVVVDKMSYEDAIKSHNALMDVVGLEANNGYYESLSDERKLALLNATCLHDERSDIIVRLVNAGRHPDTITMPSGLTAMQEAVKYNNTQLEAFLKTHGATGAQDQSWAGWFIDKIWS